MIPALHSWVLALLALVMLLCLAPRSASGLDACDLGGLDRRVGVADVFAASRHFGSECDGVVLAVWDAASGSPDGYEVLVRRDGTWDAAPFPVPLRWATIVGPVGQVVVVRVRAIRLDGSTGPYSNPSAPLTLTR